MGAVSYEKDRSGRLWWCNSHRRRATRVRARPGGEVEHCCDPMLGGITLPCDAVDLTDELEIMDG